MAAVKGRVPQGSSGKSGVPVLGLGLGLKLGRLPDVLASSLRGYKASWALPDALAAVTLLVIAVPEQLATSRLAGMPPVTGFYAFVAGSVLFALLGSNPQMSVGADSTIAPLFAAGVSALAL